MGENMYIATITSRITSTDSIVKDVTKKLNKTPNLTIEQLINYIIKDDGSFNKEEKEIMNYIKSDMQRYKEHGKHRANLFIRTLDTFGEYNFPTEDNNRSELIKPTKIAKDYFETRKIDGHDYKGLYMEVYYRPIGW